MIIALVIIALAAAAFFLFSPQKPSSTAGINEITWEAAKHHIKNCNVKEVFQRHSRVVELTLKNGETRKAVEPEIDEVFELLQEPEVANECGEIIMSTE